MIQNIHLQKILIIEDDHDFQQVFLDYFSQKSHSTIELHLVDSCLDALLKLAFNDGNYDLVVVDHNLKGKMNGLFFYRQLKRQYPHVPTIMFSGISVEEFVDLTKKQKHVPKFLSKPFSINEFENLLKDVCLEKSDQRKVAA